MRRVCLLAVAIACLCPLQAFQNNGPTPALVFSPQRLKRLKRDRERQTQRWTNFETRVKSVPDSPERGFELALYFLVTGDEALRPQLAAWSKAHPCERRQTALAAAALGQGPVVSKDSGGCPATAKAGPLTQLRDQIFTDAVAGMGDVLNGAKLRAQIMETPLNNAAEIYAAAEILSVLPRDLRATVREENTQFFSSWPVQFLLSLKPSLLDRPDWMTHIAALALVGLDPNSDSAQFLQGWAIEDRQMVQDGVGVAYELLWADPYLPGVGYQNLDPWWYDDKSGRLLARTNWTPQACSVRIEVGRSVGDGCPADWQNRGMEFGRLRLLPLSANCVSIDERPNNVTVLLHRLPANGKVKTMQSGKAVMLEADRAGMWRVPLNVTGKVCTAK